MDICISEAWLSGSEDAFTQLMHLILSENVSVDYQVCARPTFYVIAWYAGEIVTIMCGVVHEDPLCIVWDIINVYASALNIVHLFKVYSAKLNVTVITIIIFHVGFRTFKFESS
jgi:hypothetical protein